MDPLVELAFIALWTCGGLLALSTVTAVLVAVFRRKTRP